MNPRFTHDCDKCKFLGTWNLPFCQGEDLYVCLRKDRSAENDNSRTLSLSVISRFGNAGSEYRSLPWMNDVRMPSWAVLAVSWAIHLKLFTKEELETAKIC